MVQVLKLNIFLHSYNFCTFNNGKTSDKAFSPNHLLAPQRITKTTLSPPHFPNKSDKNDTNVLFLKHFKNLFRVNLSLGMSSMTLDATKSRISVLEGITDAFYYLWYPKFFFLCMVRGQAPRKRTLPVSGHLPQADTPVSGYPPKVGISRKWTSPVSGYPLKQTAPVSGQLQ